MIIKQSKKKIIIDNVEQLRTFFNKANNSHYIWVGYNCRNYDSVILKGLLLGENAWELNDKLINKGLNAYQVLGDKREEYPFINFDISDKFHSLKQLEGFMGQLIKESDIDFTIDRLLTKEEIDKTIYYCTHDVEQTIERSEERRVGKEC